MSGFFDQFFYLVSVAVVLVGFADWLLSAQARKRQREAVGDLWTYLDITPYHVLVTDVASVILSGAERLLGSITYGRKPFFRIAFLTTVIYLSGTLVGLYLGSLADRSQHYFLTPDYWMMIRMLAPNLSALAIMLWLLAISCNVVSLMGSLDLLRRLRASTGTIALTAFMLIDVFFFFFIFVVVLLVSSFVIAVTLGFYAAAELDPVFNAIAMSVFLSPLPTLLHFVVTAVMLCLKLIGPVVKKPVQLILMRVYESPKGIMTTLAFGIAALAKMVQEGVKIFGK